MRLLLAPLLLLAACGQAQPAAPAAPAMHTPAARFPAPDRPVAEIVTDTWSDEKSRDSAGEAAEVMRLSGVRPGMTVADIGAGSGYYTARLSPRVGPEGRVLAQDIVPDYLRGLAERVQKAGLTNVTTILGAPDDPRLPPASVDLALLVHMYHEIEQPYALTWRLRDALRADALVGIVDADRDTASHGTPPALLRCELAAVGYTQVGFHRLAGGNYLALFRADRPRPDPAAIRACPAGGGKPKR